VTVLEATKEHIGGMVTCHAAAFPGEFMTSMGPRWLGELYRSHVDGPGGVSLVAVDEGGKVVGLAVGGEARILDSFTARAPKQFFPLLIWKFLTVGIVRRKMTAYALRRVKSVLGLDKPPSAPAGPKPPTGPKPKSGLLLSICVLAECRGQGTADQLMTGFCDAARRAGFEVLRLSVHSDNSRAIGFYQKHGWKEVSQAGGSSIFSRDLREPSA